MSNWKMKIGVLLFFIPILGCKKPAVIASGTIELHIIDEFVLPDSIIIENIAIGGLSGIDYYDGKYYLVSDDPRHPRYYVATIEFNESEFSGISFEQVVKIRDTSKYFDLESIRYDAKEDLVLLTSEGNIKKQKDPLFFSSKPTGEIESYFNIPSAFYWNSEQRPRHNATLEGLSKSTDNNGYWIAMELPLEVDGPEPQLYKTKSPVRITYINGTTHEATNQFGYYLDPIAKQAKGDFSVNGLTELLQYDTNRFFVIERSYSEGWGNQGNTIKLFDVDATDATNIIEIDSLMGKDFKPATKTLLLDFENYRDMLTDRSIDNIEGMTFGPILSNGNRSLVLVADNNFNTMGPQLNQFILLEIVNQFSD